ncbi:MAG: response regulator [Oscillospiraceae bacterium]|nr:response regulator [Oscillospiraceae bacterium]
MEDRVIRYYHRIPGLWVENSVKHEEIVPAINEFIDTVPRLTEAVEDTFHNFETQEVLFTDAINSLFKLLQNVYASGLESDAQRIMACVSDKSKLPVASKMLKPFLTDVLSLSVRMQKAQNAGGFASEYVSEIEIHADLARNIQTVCNFLDDGENRKARRMLEQLAERDKEEPSYFRIMNLIAARKFEDAKRAAYELRAKHIDAVDKLAGTNMSKTILAVDDMPEILSFVNNALKSHYRVIAVPSAKAALNVMKTQKPDLFLFDIDMPEMDGFELLMIVRSSDEFSKKPVVFLTGNSSRDHVTAAMLNGCNDFIVKPTTYEYLLTIVGKYLG